MTKQLFLISMLHTVSLLFSRVFAVGVFFFVARFINPTEFGTLTLFLTLSTLVALVGDGGLVQWYVGKGQLERGGLEKVLFLRTLFLLVTLILSAAVFVIYPLFSPFLILCFLFNLLPEALLSVLDAEYIVQKKSYAIGIKNSIRYFFLMVTLLAFGSKSVEMMLFSYVLGSYVACAWYVPWKRIDFSKLLQTRKQVFEVFKASKNYGVLISVSALYSRSDQLLIDFFLGRSFVGAYSLAYRYLDLAVLFPTTIGQNLFGKISVLKGEEKKSVLPAVILMGSLGVLTGVLLYGVAGFLTQGVFGSREYYNSTIVLQIFALALPFFFINAPLAVVAQRANNISKFLPWGILNTVLNIVFNLIFLPKFGIVAAAWGMVLTECTGFIINCVFCERWLREKD